jgi:SnoaL-like domain
MAEVQVSHLVFAVGWKQHITYGRATKRSVAWHGPFPFSLLVFLTAFDNLDWQAFRSCFSPTATIFHPAAPNIRRIDSPDSFVNAWLGVFERIKKSSGRTSRPYMSINPVDLRVDNLCEDVALVTFHLIDGSTVSRRTLVFKRDSGGWRVVHLHASNITAP